MLPAHIAASTWQSHPLLCVQENGNTMDDEVARLCLDGGLKMLLSARHCPCPRVGALGAIHKYGMIDGVKCIVCR